MLRRKRCAIYLLSVLRDDSKPRSCWMKKWLQDRDTSSHMSLLRELRHSHHEDLVNYMRMSEVHFDELLGLVSPHISKMDTRFRQSISAEERLTATLRFLATGQSFEDLKFPTRISPQALGKIIPETSKQIYRVLKEEYVKLPCSEEEWLATSKDFENKWNFPNCGGAIDGKHIRIKKPPKSGSYFFNYKGYCSIVLMAVVNADYEFIYINVGCNGRVSDGGVIECTTFYSKLLSKRLNLPPNNVNRANLNFVFVADDAFALHENILKPYPQRQLSYDERIFNYRLSRARRIVENAFGIFSSRFRVFHTTINMKPEKIDFVVLAVCALHNFLRKKAKVTYMPTKSLDVEDIDSGEIIRGEREEDQLVGLLRQGNNKQAAETARNNRDNYKNYIVGDGAVSWQDNFVNKHLL